VTGYPIAWTEQWLSFDPSAKGSPYTPDEIASYLEAVRAQYTPLEPQFATCACTLVATRSLDTRRFWLWDVLDERGGRWWVVVGSGTSPFFGDTRNMDRWIYAESNDDEQFTPDAYLDREIAKHP
jgi:hypothetical protein